MKLTSLNICFLILSIIALSALGLFMPSVAVASEPALHVEPWKLGFQDSASPVKHKIDVFHDLLLVVITATTLFVAFLLVYVAIKFNRRANPVPSTTTHNTKLEIIWTTLPIVILVIIAVPSVKLLYYMDRAPETWTNISVVEGNVVADGEQLDVDVTVDGKRLDDGEVIIDGVVQLDGEIKVGRTLIERGEDQRIYPEMTLKVIGYQWYWGYEYPDQGIERFESIMLQEDQLTADRPYRLLEVDNRVVLPINTNIRVQITAADVIHSWAMPALGVKTDAVPGRLNETWLRIEKPGVYHGQCSELCGTLHGFMPIVIEAVSPKAFEAWAKDAKEEFASYGTNQHIALVR